MALYLGSLPSGNPQNYTVPVVDVLDPPAFPDEQIMVMPRLHPFLEPPFDTVGEFLDAVRQILEVKEIIPVSRCLQLISLKGCAFHA